MLLADFQPGAYSVVVSGVGNTTGVGLAEIYAANDRDTRNARLVNISTRGFVGSGERVLIPGFVTSGNASTWILVRAVGPGLKDMGVANPLPDPVLNIYTSGSNIPVATNDEWDTAPWDEALPGIFDRVGAFPLKRGSHDAAVYFHTAPDKSYTVVVSGKNGATGVALAEVYEVDAMR